MNTLATRLAARWQALQIELQIEFPKDGVDGDLVGAIVQLLEMDKADSAFAFASVTSLIAKRMAWGASELDVLANAEVLAQRLIEDAIAHFHDADDQCLVIEAIGQVMLTLSRDVALGTVSHAEHLRAECHRLEALQKHLRHALAALPR